MVINILVIWTNGAMDHQATGGVWTSDVIAQNTGLYQVLVKLRFNDAKTADGQGYLYTQTSSNECSIRPRWTCWYTREGMSYSLCLI